MNKEKIHLESQSRVGGGQKGRCFELGAEWVLSQISQINDLAQTAFDTAIIRGKTEKDASHLDAFFDILSELKEFREASEIDPSEHLPQYTASVEELAGIAISALTELYARVDDVEEVIVAKINYNKTRI